jgi:Fic family protein
MSRAFGYCGCMAYLPVFRITPSLLQAAEEIAALRERVHAGSINLSWLPALQKDARARNAHASTAIDGNPLSLEQVRSLEEGHPPLHAPPRAQREILNHFAALRHVQRHARKSRLHPDDILELHRILAGEAMDPGEAGRYRTLGARAGRHPPPPPQEVPGLMLELLEWWNRESGKLSPVLTSCILHHRCESIHPFADGNARMGRALGLWELYRRGFDAHHIFSVDECYWEDRPAYHRHLDGVRKGGEDLTPWLEYGAEGLRRTLDRAWLRVLSLSQGPAQRLFLGPRQEALLRLLRDRGGLAPRQIWDALSISRQGALDLLRPLIENGIVEKQGGRKTGRYLLSTPRIP